MNQSEPFLVNLSQDALFSPYSPYGNGDAAAYNVRKGGKEEISFWKNQLNVCVKRVDKIPGHVSKKAWSNVATELTSYSYNMREAMLRLADSSKNAPAATSAAKVGL